MRQVEIDEISLAFEDAWTNYFGDDMYYVPLSTSTKGDVIYNENKSKTYDYTKKVLFHGTLKEMQAIDELHQGGEYINKQYLVTFVTKELIDGGINEVDTNSIISYTNRFGTTRTYKIADEYQKVQFMDNKIFTSLVVIPSV